MQVTLSRQTGRRLQYFVAYTYGKSKGTLGNDFSNMDPYDPSRTYGVLRTDRTHILNVSWNAFLPDGARGSLDNVVLRGALNGWQVSGISTLASGIPVTLRFSGDAASPAIAAAYFGTADVVGPGIRRVAGVQATRWRRSTRAIHDWMAQDVGERILDLNCIGVPAFGEKGDLVPPNNIRTPTRMNHDLTLFKNFQVHGEQKFQFRVGLLQHLQPGVRQYEHRWRHRPDAGHDDATCGRTRLTARAACRTCATRRRASPTHPRRWTTSGRST